MKRWLFIFFCWSLLAACPSEKPASKDEQLTIVVEADRSRLAQQENELKKKFDELQQERERLRLQQERLLSEKIQAEAGDSSVRLVGQVRDLLEQQKRIMEKEKALEEEKQQLSQQKEKLPAGAVIEQIGRREASLAEREASLASREKQLAEREAALARREAEFLALQSRLGGALAKPPALVAEKPTSPAAAAKALNSLLAQMRGRGILTSDLPPQGQELLAEIEKARKAGQGAKMANLVEQLGLVLATVTVDSAFLERKFQRLATLTANKKLSDETRAELSRLQRKATTLYSDGKFEQANLELNSIFSLLSEKARGEKR